MTQRSLDFGRLYRVADGARRIYRSMDDAVDTLGIVTAAGACGYDRSDLRRDIDRAGNRSVAVEHMLAIAAVADYDARRRIVDPIVDTLGFKIVDELPPMTGDEKAVRLEAALMALGPIGEAAARAALGGRR